MIINSLTSENIKKIAEIEKLCFAKDAWSERLFLDEMIQENKHYFVLEENNGNVIGYAGFSQVLDEGHIMNVAVHPKYQGMGYGKKLMTAIESVATDLGIHAYTLEVRETNVRAKKLYEACGFMNVGSRKGYYADGESACIYWKYL